MAIDPQAVATSWQRVLDTKVDMAGIFYERLFLLEPELRCMFPADLAGQKAKLTSMLNQVVLSVFALEPLLPSVRALGARHVAYRVRERDYQAVGSALIQSLGAVLRDDFTEEVENAWLSLYDLLSREMIEAARTASRFAARQ